MYTNIDTNHALIIIPQFLKSSPLCSDITTEPIIEVLKIILQHNLFQFSNTYWKQISGVAMGAPPACCVAMIYYYLKEKTFLSTFPSIKFYTQYIDDGFLIWKHHPNPTINKLNFKNFQQSTAFGDLC